MESDKTFVPGLACLLGYAGLIPFVVLSASVFFVDNELRPSSVFALRVYAACIASFLGAIYWGLVMKAAAPASAALMWGITPSLLAFAALLVGPVPGLTMITAVLWLCYFVDRVGYPGFGLGHWLRMRLALTTIASLSCLSPLALT
jgi:hypothetical protein